VTARLLRITGRVQGVGYRDWLVREATWRGVSGWVRNRADGSVEALLAGDGAAGLTAACRTGPLLARVAMVTEVEAAPPEIQGFQRLPTL
jgi:acylphosphatase